MRNLFYVLKTHPGVKRYGKNMGWLFLEKVLRMIVTLFVGIWVVRYLGPEQFGLLSYAQSIALILIVFTGLGLDSIIVRELVRDSAHEQVILRTAIALKLAASLMVVLTLILTLFLYGSDSQSIWLILIVSLSSLFASFSPVGNYFQANVLSKYVVMANMLAFGLIGLLKVSLILLHASVTAFAITNLIECALVAVFLILFYKKKTASKLTGWSVDFVIARQLITQTWPLAIAATLAVVLDNINQVMIKWLVGLDAVGHYVAAARLSEVWFFVGAAVVSTFFPAILNAQAQDTARYERRMQRLFDLLVVLAVVIALPVAIFSQQITVLIYGEAYQDSANVLALHICAAIFVFMKAASSQWLVIHELQKYAYYQNFIAIVINVILNIMFVPIYGIAGSALAFLMTGIISFYLLLGFNRYTRPCFIMQTKALFFGFFLRKNF